MVIIIITVGFQVCCFRLVGFFDIEIVTAGLDGFDIHLRYHVVDFPNVHAMVFLATTSGSGLFKAVNKAVCSSGWLEHSFALF